MNERIFVHILLPKSGRVAKALRQDRTRLGEFHGFKMVINTEYFKHVLSKYHLIAAGGY